MLPEFDLLRPRSLPEALEMLAESDVMPIAGGTNVVVDLRAGKHRPRALVDIGRLDGLRGIRHEDGMPGNSGHGYLVVGGGTTISDLLDDPLIARYASALREAAQVFANPLIRNRATVGGNLVDASPAADTAPPLLVLDAEVELSGQGGTRCVPLADFLVGVRVTVRRPDELLTAVRCPGAGSCRPRQPLLQAGAAQSGCHLGVERRGSRDVGRRWALHGCPGRAGRAGPSAVARDRGRASPGRSGD